MHRLGEKLFYGLPVECQSVAWDKIHTELNTDRKNIIVKIIHKEKWKEYVTLSLCLTI
jgi:hypothetical protein